METKVVLLHQKEILEVIQTVYIHNIFLAAAVELAVQDQTHLVQVVELVEMD
tara:strand:+ start:286 stop:441 length:156 start_codon:yes stop_codon:yes gene_type:complete